ncbi:helix-turn-helix domain-containing protein [Candidatus Ruminimicrobium bovinum]|uniref:AlbA family DNA-binding domain-containing protein n=1 Tax=Candidatus Ruminimicrobium bovinum TaxID=3242779 RepID=UPI0039B9AA00
MNLKELLKLKENNKLEFKKAKGGLPQSIWETYSAFANTDGGCILLGLEELSNKQISIIGIETPQKLITQFWNEINNKQKVSINILTDKNIEIINYKNKDIIKISVPRSDRHNKPIFINNDLL